VLGTPTLRLRGDYLAIVTLGFGEIIRITAINNQWLGGSAGIKNVARPPSSDWQIPGTDIAPFKYGVVDLRPYYWLTLTFLILVIILLRNLERSRVGRAWVAIREDEDAAELMGVPTFRFKLLSFSIGAAIGGMAGALFSAKQGFINPQSFPLLNSILFLAAVVLGGAGNLPGVLLGACVIAYLPERFRGFQNWRFFIFGVALVVMMIFRPQGLLPNRRRAAEVEARQIDAEGQDVVLDVEVEATS
jgi:branched-chain amino acid transport system permease protein